MPNLTRLGKGATKKIHNAIEDLFDKAKVRLLGPQSIRGKKLFITYSRELSLPGLFEAGSMEEYNRPDLEVLDSLIRVTSAYVDAHKERTKARIVHEINGAIAEVKHSGGMSRQDFRDLVNNKLSEVWSDVTRNIHSIVDTELAHAKNVSVLDGVVGVNAQAGVSDPVVYFVVVRDADLCDECKRLHLMDDGKTPRLWYLSELGHGYHKKGEDKPKIGGLHPHCRCTLVTLLPSYGFTKDGMVRYVKRGHLEIEAQRRLERSEPLNKSESGWDPSKHPRDPATGEFINHDRAARASLKGNSMAWRHYEGNEEAIKEFSEHLRKVLRAAKENNPKLYDMLVADPTVADSLNVDSQGKVYAPDEEGVYDPSESEPEEEPSDDEQFEINVAAVRDVLELRGETTPEAAKKRWEKWVGPWPESREEQVRILKALGIRHLSVAKAEYWQRHPLTEPIHYTPSAFTNNLINLMLELDDTDGGTGTLPLKKISGINHLMFGFKDHAGGKVGQFLKYVGYVLDHPIEYSDNLGLARIADEDFNRHNLARIEQRQGMRGLQGQALYAASRPEPMLTAQDLRPWLIHNRHLIDQWREHEQSLQEKLHRENPSGYVILARAFREPGRPRRHNIISSFTDDPRFARVDGKNKGYIWHYKMPIHRIALSYAHGGPPAFGDPKRGGGRTSEHEFLGHPPKPGMKDEFATPLEVEEGFRIIYPHFGGGRAVHQLPKHPETGKVIRDPPLRLVRSELSKALSEVPVGKPLPTSISDRDTDFDYSHLLPPELASQGYKVSLNHRHYAATPEWIGGPAEPERHWLEATLLKPVSASTPEEIKQKMFGNQPESTWEKWQRESYKRQVAAAAEGKGAFAAGHRVVGHAVGQVTDGVLTPHFNDGVDKSHRGMGVGKALYNTIFGHAYNVLGAKTCKGGMHSEEASRVHQSLSRQHGMEYQSETIKLPTAKQIRKQPDAPLARQSTLLRRYIPRAKTARSAYDYALKRELNPGKGLT